MTFRDLDLTYVESHGIPPLPEPDEQGFVENEGARIWYASHGSGPAVILLHGGMGNSGNWGYQVPAIVEAGYRAVVIDSRGHGRSTRDAREYSYQLMAADTRAVMDRLGIEKAAIVGWSDGADTALILAQETPERVAGIFFFACNVDDTGTKPFVFTLLSAAFGSNIRRTTPHSRRRQVISTRSRQPSKRCSGHSPTCRRQHLPVSPCPWPRSLANLTNSSSRST